MRVSSAAIAIVLITSGVLSAQPVRVTGDADGDGTVATGDIFHTVNHVFAGGPAATGYGDVNGDAVVNVNDASYLAAHVLGAGPKPMEPWRLLEQATFGPDQAATDYVRSIGFSAFLDEQLNAAPPVYPTYEAMPATPPPDCAYPSTCFRDRYTTYPLQRRFFTNAVYGEDQLRQRVAFALHKIWVVSGLTIQQPNQLLPYLKIIDAHAFGNFRDLMEEITLNPAMGFYLDMVTNTRTNPNENYSREILQLFTVGTDLLNLDGTPQRDGNGEPIPTYDQAIVDGFTKVFTGWSFAPQQTSGIINFQDPMVQSPSNENNHDKTEKLLLSGVTLPANQTAAKDLEDALDNIFNHPNVGPFIARQLIQNLVTSNPSPAHVARVATVFNDNGAGVRGDMRAVVRAVLLDAEARNDAPAAVEYGRLREPALFLTGVLRAFNARAFSGTAGSTSDGYLNPLSEAMGQSIYRPPTVFSYFAPDYQTPGTSILGPEFGIISSSTVLARANAMNALVFNGITTTADAPNGTRLSFDTLLPLASTAGGLADELNRVLMHGTMSTAMRDSIISAVNAIADTPANADDRVMQAVYLVLTSSQYQVER